MLREGKWKIYHQFEDEQKRKFLQRLSINDSFKVFEELYDFACHAGWIFQHQKFDKDRINHLVKIHSLFGKLK